MEKKYFGVMLDCSRNAVMNVETVKKFASVIAGMGYNMLMLYTEDTYEIPGEPLFGYLRGRYTQSELCEIVDYCEGIGIEVIPCIQTLAHLNQIFKWDEYKACNDTADILLIDDDRTYALIEKMFASIRKCFKTNKVHIGMDEADTVGKGKYRDLHGDTERFSLIGRHLQKVADIAKKYGFEPMMWSDMFFKLATGGVYTTKDSSIITKDIAKHVPENVSLVYWDYSNADKAQYDTMIEAHMNFGKPVWFAGGLWTWLGFTPHNQRSLSRTGLAMQSCREHDVGNIIITLWGDNGGECSAFSVLPALFYSAEVYHGNNDLEDIKKKFKKKYSISFDDFLMLDSPAILHAGEEEEKQNPDKFMLYNDPFLGIYDNLAVDGKNVKKRYKKNAAVLHELAGSSGEYGYLFELAAELCDVLAIKYDLGLRTREAYRANDLSAIKKLVTDYKSCAKRVNKFYGTFKKVWYNEKKGNGFEVQDIRLGGLSFRLMHCADMLSAYASGNIARIDELEEDIIPTTERYLQNVWSRYVTNSVL